MSLLPHNPKLQNNNKEYSSLYFSDTAEWYNFRDDVCKNCFKLTRVYPNDEALYVSKEDNNVNWGLHNGMNETVFLHLNFYNSEKRLHTYNELIPNQVYYIIHDVDNIWVYSKNGDDYYTIEDVIINKNDTIMIPLTDYMKSTYSDIDIINETLNYSTSSKRFIELLQKILLRYGCKNFYITELKSKNIAKRQIKIIFDEKLDDVKDIIMLANLCGYKLSESSKNNKQKYETLFTPYYTESANNIIYDKYNGIIYHLTSRYAYDKFLKEGKIRYRATFGFEGKSRIYVFSNNDWDELEKSVTRFKRLSKRLEYVENKVNKGYYDKNTLLKIDLNKLKDKIDFYHDSAYNDDSYPVYCKNEIPSSCIIKVYNVTDKEILNEL